jgi:hypothetical protein
MAGRDSGKVGETEGERAFAEVAMQRIADYKQRWMPVIQRAGEIVRSMGAEDSVERQRVAGATVGATRQKFTGAVEATEKANRAAGVRADSGRAKLGTIAMGDAEAMSAGIGTTKADQAIDDAYVQGLTKIMQLGRGQAAGAIRNMGDVARDAASVAQSDAALAASRRMGNADLAGTMIGAGIGAMGDRPRTPAPSRTPSSAGLGEIANPFAGV